MAFSSEKLMGGCINPPDRARVKVDQTLSTNGEYLFVGQRSNDFEVADALIRPFSESEIPLYARNRSDRVITAHRRSVIGFIERFEHVDTRTPDHTDSFEVNAVSADDGRFLGSSSADDVLGEFVIGEPLSAGQRDKLASLLRSFPEVFSRGYADIGLYKGGDVDLELQCPPNVCQAVPSAVGEGRTVAGPTR